MKRRRVAHGIRSRSVSRRVARPTIALGALVSLLLALGCEPADQSPVGRGRRVFQRTCSGCHGADGRGVMRLGLAKPPRDLTNPEFHAQVTDEELLRVIRTGKNQMPAFGGLMGDEDLRNVIAFIRTLAPGAKARQPSALMPPPAAAPANDRPTGDTVTTPPSALVAPPHVAEPKDTVQ